MAAAALSNAREFLRFQTVCTPGAPLSVSEAAAPHFESALAHLKAAYKALLSSDDVVVSEVNTYSLLLEWTGSRPELPGIMVYGHYDVVPVGNDSLPSWSHNPFGGQSFDGWGFKSQIATFSRGCKSLACSVFEGETVQLADLLGLLVLSTIGLRVDTPVATLTSAMVINNSGFCGVLMLLFAIICRVATA